MNQRGLRKIPFSYVDQDPQRGRLLRNLTDQANRSSGVTVDIQAPPTANAEFAVRHELGRVPREVEIVKQDSGGVIYRSSPGRWTKSILYLKFSLAGGKLSIRLR